jgi:outer membrane phospholipase A
MSETMAHHPLTQIQIMHRLKKVGFTQEQSEAQAQIITEVNENSLATKQDVKNLEKKTNSEFSLLRQEMKSEFALVRKEMDTLKLDLTVRITVIMGSLLTLFSAIQKFLIQ